MRVGARLAAQDPFSLPASRDQATVLIARTQLLVADEQGRVRLPDAMIEHAGLKDRVAFVGKAQKFQIWDWERYAPIEAGRLARVKDRMLRLRADGGALVSGHIP